MGIFDGVRDFYFGLEEKYYDFLDGLNQHIPAYELVDPIDKVVPSFLLFIALFFAAIGLVLAGTFGVFGPIGNDTLTISVQDSGDNPIAGAAVTFSRDGKIVFEAKTNAQGIAVMPGVKKDDRLGVVAEKGNYLSNTKTVIVFQLPASEIIKLDSEALSVQRTIRLLDELGQPATDSFTVRFKCSNPYAPSIADISLTPSERGVAIVNVPGNCERLTVDVLNNNSHREIYGQSVNSPDQTIRLEAADTESATIVVNVTDASGRPLDGIEVQLFKYSELLQNPNIGPIDVSYASGGQAIFTKSPGNYIVKTYDARGEYGDQTSGKIVATAKERATTGITMRQEIKGKVLLRVVDKKSGNPIGNAGVTLLYATSGSADSGPITTVLTIADGTAGINVSKDVGFRAVVGADGFQSRTIGGLRISSSATTIELDRCTAATCGLMKIKVVDQDGTPIDGSIVTLYNASTNFRANYSHRTTDINGVAKLSGVSNGNYYAFAFKEGFSGRSDAQSFNGDDQNRAGEQFLTVVMNVEDGIVQINVHDTEGRPISFATISLLDARANALIGKDITDSNGTKEFTLKANKKIYAIVSKQDEQIFANYTTAKKALIPAGVVQLGVTMEKPSLKNSIEMEFLGLYSAEGKRAQNLRAGDTYSAKFKVRIPEEQDYDTAGVHIRTGSDVLMEKDALFIKEVNAPKTSQVRATRFEPEQGNLDGSNYETTAGDAKWVNLEWVRPGAGIYEIEAQIEVRQSASVGDKLLLNYRAWGEEDNGPRDRFPVDDTVGREIYSNTKQEIFQIGVVTLCDEGFCFTATITDKRNDLVESVQDTYNAKMFNPYSLQFVITNNSEARIHNNANLRIDNADESLKFFDYTMIDAESQPISGTLNGFEFPRLNVGDLRPKNSIRFVSEFTPQKSVSGILNIKLVSDQEIVFEKNLSVIVAAPKELDVLIEPNVFLSGIQNDISVLVTDKADGLEVEGAVVRIKDGRKNVLDYAVTGKDGNAALTLPGQKPGKKLYLEIERQDYNVKIIELDVSDKLLEVLPSQLGVALNTKNKQQADSQFSLNNIAPYPLTIKGIRLSGTFRNLLDTTRIRNWLDSSYKGMVIGAEGKRDLTLKTFLSQDALALKNRINLDDAELIITASNFGQEWVFKVPVKIAIGLGDEVDDPTCLVVTKSDWTTSTSGTPKRIEFQIQNNCTVGKKPVALQNLEAKINWKTNQLGEFNLNIGADDVTLRPGYYRILLGMLKAEQSLTAILNFTPIGGISGLGEADIVIQATNPLEDEDQILQNTIKTKITSVNLKQCLSYDKERFAINQDETGTVTITATEVCGEPVDFEIKSDLRTTPKSEFTLQPGQSQVIQVFSEKNYPGQYALYILPKFASDKREQLQKNIRVVVNAPGCWQLSKYEFDVYDGLRNDFDGFDTANLANNCVERPVSVKVNAKDWLDAAQDGLFWGIASMGITMLTNWGEGDYSIWGKKTDAGKKAEIAKLEAEKKQALDNKDYKAAAEKQMQINQRSAGTTQTGKKPGIGEEGYVTPLPPAGSVMPKSATEPNAYVVDTSGEYTLLSDGFWYDGRGDLVNGISQKQSLWNSINRSASGTTSTTALGDIGPGGIASPNEPVFSYPNEIVTADGAGYPNEVIEDGKVYYIDNQKQWRQMAETTPNANDPILTNEKEQTVAGGDLILQKLNETYFGTAETMPADIGPGGIVVPDTPVTSTNIQDIGPGGTVAPPEAVQSANTYLFKFTSSGGNPIPSDIYKVSTAGDIYDSKGIRKYYRKAATTEWYDVSTSSQLSTLAATTLESLTQQAVIKSNTPTGNVVLPTTGSALIVTGLANENNPLGGLFGGAAQGAGSSLGTNLLKGGGGLVRNLLGANPFVAGIMGFAVGTIISYFGQEKEVTFTILSQDTEIKNVRVIQGSGPAERDDRDIVVSVKGLGGKDESGKAPTNPQPLAAPNPNLLSQGIETLKLTFVNKTKFTTTEEQPKTPYPHLLVEGVRHEYKDKTYDKKDFINESGGFIGFFDTPTVNQKKTKLEEDTPKNLEQQYRLEFNSIPPTLETNQPIALLSCQDGTRTGSTGTDALPKVKFAWSWSEIEQDTCNENNENGFYCDATQLSIALLKKVDAIRKYVADKGPQFQCPSPIEDKPATNEIGSFDIGVESLSTVKKGNDIEIIAIIKNTNPGPINGSALLKVKPTQGTVVINEKACPGGAKGFSVAAGGEATISCTFAGLAQGFYNATAAITPGVSCPNCQDISATNTLSRNFFAGKSGLQQCEPYNTSRLADFLAASGEEKDDILAMTKFNALLMADGYSSDFQHDFDSAQKQSFFSAPEMYTNKTNGLGNYFRDTKLWTFDAYSQPEFILPGPGTYSIGIGIGYNDNSWQLFDSNGNPKAKIVITMEKLHGAEPDSPFYYVPLDGLVGQDSGRIGYGVNFAGDSILIDNSQTPIRTVEISGSAPINDGVLNVTKSKSFKSMQVDERGVVAKLSRQGGNPSLLFAPSNATPVILQITKNTGDDAYAIYEPEIGGNTAGNGGEAVDVGPQLTLWNGIGASCRGFDDTVMSQQQFVPYTHGISTRCRRVGQN